MNKHLKIEGRTDQSPQKFMDTVERQRKIIQVQAEQAPPSRSARQSAILRSTLPKRQTQSRSNSNGNQVQVHKPVYEPPQPVTR